MDAVDHAINRLMRKLEGNVGDLDALETICTALRESINSTPNNARDEINRLANGALESLSNRNLVMLKLLIDDILRLTSPIS